MQLDGGFGSPEQAGRTVWDPGPRRERTASVLPWARLGNSVACTHSVIVVVATAATLAGRSQALSAVTSSAKSSIHVMSSGLTLFWETASDTSRGGAHSQSSLQGSDNRSPA